MSGDALLERPGRLLHMLTAVDELGGQIETNDSAKHLGLAVVLLDTASAVRRDCW